MLEEFFLSPVLLYHEDYIEQGGSGILRGLFGMLSLQVVYHEEKQAYDMPSFSCRHPHCPMFIHVS